MKICEGCGSKWGETTFIWMSTEDWKRIGCLPTDFLCSHCVLDRVATITSYAYLVMPNRGIHNMPECNTQIEVKDFR